MLKSEQVVMTMGGDIRISVDDGCVNDTFSLYIGFGVESSESVYLEGLEKEDISDLIKGLQFAFDSAIKKKTKTNKKSNRLINCKKCLK